MRDCRLCGTRGTPHEVLGHPPLTNGGPFRVRDYALIRCRACDVVYLDPLPPAADLDTLYRGVKQFENMHCANEAEASRTVRSYARRLRHLGLMPERGDSILEIGAGLAWIARVCKDACPGVRTVAQDVSDECARRCPWVDEYIVGPVESVPRTGGFRLVSLTHVIEHLLAPEAMLAAASDLAAPGGHVYITAPFRPPLWQPGEGFGPWLAYEYLHVPAHISYLSERWLCDAAARTGLKVARWDASHDGHQVFEAVLQKAG